MDPIVGSLLGWDVQTGKTLWKGSGGNLSPKCLKQSPAYYKYFLSQVPARNPRIDYRRMLRNALKSLGLFNPGCFDLLWVILDSTNSTTLFYRGDDSEFYKKISTNQSGFHGSCHDVKNTSNNTFKIDRWKNGRTSKYWANEAWCAWIRERWQAAGISAW